MRIAITINSAWNIYNFRLGIVQALLAEGHEVIAVAPEDKYVDALTSEGCEFIHVAMDNQGANPVKDFGIYRSLKRIYRDANIDLALQYTIKPNIYGTLAAKRIGMPVINNISGLGTTFIHENLVGYVAKLLYRISLKHASLVFFQNQDDRDLFLQKKLIAADKTELIPGSGVDLERFAYEPPKQVVDRPFHFLVVARLLYDKGIVEFVDAVRLLKQEGLDLQCSLCGFLASKSSLEIPIETVREWEAEGLIHYLGAVDQIENIIRDADCVVLPSYREGTPKSLLEAAAMGKPLIATDVPGCREVVTPDYNGFLCEAKSHQSLAAAMKKMQACPYDQLLQMSQNSRQLVQEKFDQQIVIDHYLNAIKRIAPSSG